MRALVQLWLRWVGCIRIYPGLHRAYLDVWPYTVCTVGNTNEARLRLRKLHQYSYNSAANQINLQNTT
jgi:hypothetical protein